jgi:glycosyltransferase involved in cell wall biosynthesis
MSGTLSSDMSHSSMTRLRVGMITQAADQSRTGTANYILGLVSAMKTQGHADELFLFHGTSIRTGTMYGGTNETMIRRLPGRLEYCTTLPRAIHSSLLSVLHLPLHGLHQTIPAMLNPRVTCVMTIHDITPTLFPEMHTRKAVVSSALALRMARLLVDHYITDSMSTKRDLVRHLSLPEDAISVIYPGKDERFRPLGDTSGRRASLARRLRLPLDEPYILSVGTLEPRKNVTGLLKAYATLRRAGVTHRLVVVGMKGWKYAPIFDLVHELNLDHCVVFPGYVADEDLPGFYNGADVFVYPSLYEGFGLPPLEAMACGVPVVVSNTSSLPEVVGPAGLLVDPTRPEDIAMAVLDLLSSECKRVALAQAGIEQAAHFDWASTAQETWSIYERTVHDSRAHDRSALP